MNEQVLNFTGKKGPKEELPVTIAGTSEVIPDVYKFERVGAGHDGYIFRFHDKAFKILKYDINLRKEKGLMTFEKALYFQKNLHLERITQPTGVLLDQDGIYVGYVMDYIDNLASDKKKGTPQFREPGSYSCGDLINSWTALTDDFEQLSSKGVLVRDINRGSYLYDYDFLHLCDTDKYELHNKPTDLNQSALNFTMAKFLLYEMEKTEPLDKSQKKILSQWVKKSSNSRNFYSEVKSDIGNGYSTPISEYAEYKVKTLLK